MLKVGRQYLPFYPKTVTWYRNIMTLAIILYLVCGSYFGEDIILCLNTKVGYNLQTPAAQPMYCEESYFMCWVWSLCAKLKRSCWKCFLKTFKFREHGVFVLSYFKYELYQVRVLMVVIEQYAFNLFSRLNGHP